MALAQHLYGHFKATPREIGPFDGVVCSTCEALYVGRPDDVTCGHVPREPRRSRPLLTKHPRDQQPGDRAPKRAAAGYGVAALGEIFELAGANGDATGVLFCGINMCPQSYAGVHSHFYLADHRVREHGFPDFAAFRCGQCKKPFQTASALQYHVIKAHRLSTVATAFRAEVVFVYTEEELNLRRQVAAPGPAPPPPMPRPVPAKPTAAFTIESAAEDVGKLWSDCGVASVIVATRTAPNSFRHVCVTVTYPYLMQCHVVCQLDGQHGDCKAANAILNEYWQERMGGLPRVHEMHTMGCLHVQAALELLWQQRAIDRLFKYPSAAVHTWDVVYPDALSTVPELSMFKSKAHSLRQHIRDRPCRLYVRHRTFAVLVVITRIVFCDYSDCRDDVCRGSMFYQSSTLLATTL